MTESSKLPIPTHNSARRPARPSRRLRIVLLAFALWTAFVAFALSRLLANSGPTVWIIHDEGSPQSLQKGRAISRTDAGLQRIYPWVLFGPYVALLAAYFPLERGRLRLSLPLNLAACAAFVTTCHEINARTSLKATNIMFVANQKNTPMAMGSEQTNVVRIEMLQGGAAANSLSERIEKTLAVASATNAGVSNFIGIVGQHDFTDRRLTNLLAQLPPGMGPGLKPPPPPGVALLPTFLDLLAYCAIIGLTHSVHFYRRFRERERSALVLESNLARARLSALRAQLHPHFLFNSLNAIATLLRRDPRLAEATLMSLSDLLRLALSQAERQEVPLREELHFVQRYLEIQQTRFGDRLSVEQDIDSAALDCLVPTLLLQPLVENAIRHGLEPAEHAGVLRLTAHRNNGELVLTVEDNGMGLSATPIDLPDSGAEVLSATEQPATIEQHGTAQRIVFSNGHGIGLSNLRARLQMLYGESQKLELGPRSGGGVIVRVEIPWHPAASVETSTALAKT